MEKEMKSLITVFTLSILLVACGDNESGDSKKSSNLSSLSSAGITLVSDNTGASNTNIFNASDLVRVNCVDNNARGVNNTMRLERLRNYKAQVARSSRVTISGKNYDAFAVESLIDDAIRLMEYAVQYENYYGNNGINGNNFNNNNNNNNYVPCPRALLSSSFIFLAR